MTTASRSFRAGSPALALVGLGLSAYLTIEHYSANATLACPTTGSVDCATVTSGAESSVAGIPVAVLGLAFFVAMLALTLPWAWSSGAYAVHALRLVAVVVGMVFALWLIYAELFRINALCLWCTGVHVVTFALFTLVSFAAAGGGLRPSAERSEPSE